jgi:hypothetical protein
MIFLVIQNGLDRGVGLDVGLFLEIAQLIMQVVDYDGFDSPSAGHDSRFSEQRREESHHVAAEATQPVALAFDAVATLYLRPENREMALLVSFETVQKLDVVSPE